MLDDNLEDYFKENLENVHTAWDKDAFWDDLAPLLPEEKKRRPILWFWIGGITAAVLLVGLTTWFLTNSPLDTEVLVPSVDIKKQDSDSTPIAANTTTEQSNINHTSTNSNNNVVTNNDQEQLITKTTSTSNTYNSISEKSNTLSHSNLLQITEKETPVVFLKEETQPTNQVNSTPEKQQIEQVIVDELPIIANRMTTPELQLMALNSIDFEKGAFENRIKVPKKSTPLGLSITPYAGIGMINRTLTSSVANDELLTLRNEQETTLEAIDLGIQIRKTWKNGLFIQSGIELSTLHEQLSYTESSSETVLLQSDTASFYQSFTGLTQFRKGEIEAQSVTNTRFERHNQYQFLNIPLLVGYQRQIGKCNIGLALGPVFTVNQQFSGYAYNDAMEVIASDQIKIAQQLNISNIDAIANIDFPLYRNVQFVAGIKYRYGLSYPQLNTTISQRYKVGSTFVGLRFIL